MHDRPNRPGINRSGGTGEGEATTTKGASCDAESLYQMRLGSNDGDGVCSRERERTSGLCATLMILGWPGGLPVSNLRSGSSLVN